MNEVEITLLGNPTYECDEKGNEIEVLEEIEIFASERSIRSNEFYEASRQGLRLSRMFVIKPYEYNLEECLLYEGKKYKVERTYQKNTEELELICSEAE